MKRLKVTKNDIDLHFTANVGSIDGKIAEAVVIYGGDLDYNKLKNKPSLGGRELVGNIDELDPQVPAWAKEEEKPAEPIATEEVEKWLNTEEEETP